METTSFLANYLKLLTNKNHGTKKPIRNKENSTITSIHAAHIHAMQPENFHEMTRCPARAMPALLTPKHHMLQSNDLIHTLLGLQVAHPEWIHST
jgi:hypothetical protein